MNKLDVLITLMVVSVIFWVIAAVNHNHNAFVAWIIVIVLSISIIEESDHRADE